MFDLIVILFY